MAEVEFVAGIDAGGTSFKLGLANEAGDLLAFDRVPTTTPAETIALAVRKLSEMASEQSGVLARVGIASFGPVDVDPASARYGTILETPKPAWSNTPLLADVTARLGVPGRLDTDVNGALAAESRWGAARAISRAAYVTVGTGIGAGIVCDGRYAGRPHHPELGHIRIQRHPGDLGANGVCAFHGDCLEGLTSGPALAQRFGRLEEASDDALVWDVAGYYLAQLAWTLILGWRVERVIFGGGVLAAPSLIGHIRRHLEAVSAGYLAVADGGIETVVQLPQLGQHAGVLGACAVALRDAAD